MLEMVLMSSNTQITCVFKLLCKIINKGEKADVLKKIEDPLLRNFLERALDDNPE
jgi:hypothetical protein